MAWTKEQFQEHYKTKHDELIQMFGGKCKECDSIENLHFHHKDPTTKVTSVTKLMRYKWTKILEEVQKCDLLCEECHKEKHAHITIHGTPKTYRHGCRCNLCREAMRNYIYEWRSVRKPNGEVLGCNPS